MSRTTSYLLGVLLGLVVGVAFGAAIYTRGASSLSGFGISVMAAMTASALGFVLYRREHT